MPIYEYRCGSCGHELDVLQKMADAPLSDCPECGASALKRLVSAPNFRLKGGGWYETDFKTDSDKQRNLADKGDKGSSASDGDGAGKTDAAKDGPKPAKDGDKTPAKEKPKAKSDAADSA